MDPVVSKIAAESITPKGGEAGVRGQGDSDFKKLLDGQLNGNNESLEALRQNFGLQSPDSSQLKAIPAEQISINPSQTANGQKSDILKILSDVNRSALQMDQIVEMVSSGRTMEPQQILACQASFYSIVHEIELTSQITASADRARNSLLNIQV